MVMNKHLIIASALFSALVLPAVALSGNGTETQTASITIANAVGSTPASNYTIGSNAAPSAPSSGTTGSATTVSGTTATTLNVWSNQDGWSVSVKGDPLASGGSPLPTPKISLGCSSYTNIPAAAGTAFTYRSATGTLKNTNNNANTQSPSACYQQDVSWTNAPGTYTGSFTHAVTPGS